MDHRRLKWLTFLVATAAVLAMQFVLFDRALPLLGPLPPAWRLTLRAGSVVAGVYLFNAYVFHLIGRVNRALVQERERLAALHQIGQALASLAGVERNLAATLEVARRTAGADLVVWAEREVREGPGVEAVCRVFAGERRSGNRGVLRLRVGQGVVGRALSTGRPVELEDAAEMPEADRRAYPLVAAEALRTVFAVPTGSRERAAGAVVVGWRRRHRLTAAERSFIENVAYVVGTAVENARLYREVQRLAVYEERDRLAREMHDGIAQALTYLKLKAEALQQHAGAGRWPAVQAGIEDVRRAALEALGDVRQAIVDLRAASARPGGEGFLAHLAEYLHTWSRLNDIECELIAPEGELVLPEEAELQVMRILQEALANVRKHAAAQHVQVRAQPTADGFCFAVSDDGRGFDPAQPARPGHYGMAVLRERAAAIGGRIEITSAPGAGTRVALWLPGQAGEDAARAGGAAG